MTMVEEGYVVCHLVLVFGGWELVADVNELGCTRRIIRGSIKDG